MRSIYTLLFVILIAPVLQAQPNISQVISPSTIGPGSTTTLIITISNIEGDPTNAMNFSHTLPAAITIAAAPNGTTDCLNGIVSAPSGGSTITFSNGEIGTNQVCTISVNVTSSTLGTHTSPAITMMTSEGNSTSGTTDLTVVKTLPGFSKSFAPSLVDLGETSTLSFLIDNSLDSLRIGNLDFTDILPNGLVIANPSNASTDCISAGLPDTELTAAPGTSTIVLNANGINYIAGFEVLSAGASCSVTLDVEATAVGMLANVSGDLLADFVVAGKASAILEVTREDIHIQKSFTDDPTPPGGTVNLEFIISNFDRNNNATAVSFTDDLTTALAGLTFSSVTNSDCGGMITGDGTTSISLSGGTIPAEGNCTINI